MALMSKIIISLAIVFESAFGNASSQQVKMTDVFAINQGSCIQDSADEQAFTRLFVQATLAAGRCNGSYDCSWPTTQCVNNRCVKPNGDGGGCNGSYDCSWPTTECRNGNCVKPNGDGGECNGSYDCSWPYTQCKNGNCERP